MSLDRLEEPGNDPDVDGDDVEVDAGVDKRGQVRRREGHQERAADRAGAEDENFERMSILSREAEGGRKLMVELVNVLRRRDEKGAVSTSARFGNCSRTKKRRSL